MTSCSTPEKRQSKRKRNNNVGHEKKKGRHVRHRTLIQETSKTRQESEILKNQKVVLEQVIVNLTAEIQQKDQLITKLQQEQTNNEILDHITQLQREINDFQKNQ